MSIRHPGAIAAAVLALSVPATARALEGRYIGSVTRSTGADDVSSTLHNYDVGTQKSFSNTVSMNLRLSLLYQARLDQSNQELLGSRVYGDLRGTIWRLRGQFNPWQDVSPGPGSARDRNAQLGFNLSPRSLPHLDLNWTRGDGESTVGRSISEDRRANLSWSRGFLSTGTSFRRVDRRILASSTPSARTDEWKATVAAAKSWRSIAVTSAYEFLTTQYASAARRRDARSHSVDLSATWRPVRRLTVGGNSLLRRGTTDDNALPAARDVDETSYGGRVGFQPWTSLDLQASREYRRSQTSGGNETSDYGRFQATWRRALIRRVQFQSGWQKNVEIGNGGSIPADNLYAQLDGPLRSGLYGRVELRTATSGTGFGRQWRRLAQLRGDPVPEMHVEATWRRDSMPDSLGPGQTQNEWSTTMGFAPESVFSLTANGRWLTGSGRVDTQEKLANLLVTWRRGDRSQVSFNWSSRSSRAALQSTHETVYGFDLTTWFPGDYRVTGSARTSTATVATDTKSWSLSVEKNF